MQKIILDTIEEKPPIERCGYCGRYFRGNSFLTKEDEQDFAKLDKYNLGYCPDAQREHYEQNPDDYPDQYNSDDYPR